MWGVELAIRISRKDRQKLESIYGKTNKARQKYNRLRRSGVAETQLPLVPTSAKKLVSYAKTTGMTRQEFNSFVDSLLEFSQPRNPKHVFEINKHGVALSKEFISEAEEATRKAQQEKQQHYQEQVNLDINVPTQNVIATPDLLVEMGADLPFSEIRDFDPDIIRSENAIETYIENIERQNSEYFNARDDMYKENFIKTLKSVFNSLSDDIVELIKAMETADFIGLYVQNFLDLGISYIYDEVEVQGKAEEMYNRITDIFENATGANLPKFVKDSDDTVVNSETGEIYGG